MSEEFEQSVRKRRLNAKYVKIKGKLTCKR